MEATEEAIVNALLAAGTMRGANGIEAHGLDGERVARIMRRYGRGPDGPAERDDAAQGGTMTTVRRPPRAATLADIPAIARVAAASDEPIESPGVPGSPYAEHLLERGTVVVAETDDGVVVGYASAVTIDTWRHVTDLFVHPARATTGSARRCSRRRSTAPPPRPRSAARTRAPSRSTCARACARSGPTCTWRAGPVACPIRSSRCAS